MTGTSEARLTPHVRGALAAELAALHVPRRIEELHGALADALLRILPDTGFAALLYEDTDNNSSVVAAQGAECPFQRDSIARTDAWRVPDQQRFWIRYGEQNVGELQVGERLDPRHRGELQAVLAHYATALVNLTLTAESQDSTELYCANLQALEQGVVLFQETDPDTITARLLGLCTTLMGAAAGALYVLEKVGDTDSELRLVQALGIPEQLLATISAASGGAWPRNGLGKPHRFARREEDPSMGGMDPESIPDVLQSMVISTLEYHGVVAGLLVLFNATPPGDSLAVKMSSLGRLGQLGAAILHRLHLEEVSRQSRELETQLKIASTIQSRLLPASAPPCTNLQFAWRSQTAQYIGGDYLDLIGDGTGDTAAVIADVSGHGVNSALLMSSFRSFYRAEARLLEPHRMLDALNKEVHHEVGATGMFITAAAFRIAPDARSMRFSGAGHNPVFLYRAADGSVEELESDGPPLGFMDGIEFHPTEIQLHPGDVLVLYTDGIVEATDDRDEMFGEDRLKACVTRTASSSADEVLAHLFDELVRFTDSDTQLDDVSVSVIKVTN